MDAFAPLQTARLKLEPITAEVARSIAVGDVAELQPADGWPHEHTKNGIDMALRHGHPAGWLVRFEGRVIGDCGIHAPVDDNGSLEIGYGLAAPYRGRGFGTEVATVISGWLLSQPGVSVVRATTLPANVASQRVLEKAGFSVVRSGDAEIAYELRHNVGGSSLPPAQVQRIAGPSGPAAQAAHGRDRDLSRPQESGAN